MPSRFIRSEQPEALRRGLSWLYAFVRPQRGAILRLLALSLLASALVLLQPWLTKLLIDDGLLARDRRVFEWAWTRRLPLALSMGGGYGHDIATTVQVQMNTFDIAAEYWRRWQNAAR